MHAARVGASRMQILHAGRYGYHPLAVWPSRLKSPIWPFSPRALSERGIERQIRGFVRCATLAREAGYDGVEIMGSEGYFINQFIAAHTNRRTDGWGGSFENRMRLPVEIVRRTREAVARTSSSTGSRCSTWCRTAATGARSCGSRRPSNGRAPPS